MFTTSLKVLLTALLANVALGAVQVAVVEVGHPKGTLHSTTTADDGSSAEHNNVSLSQLASFWNTVHGNSGSSSLSLGTAGFPVVPDLFHRPEGGLVLGLGRRPHHELNLEGTVATLDIAGLSTTQVLKHVEPTPFTMDEAHFFEESSSSNYLSSKLTGFEVQDYCIHKAIAQLHEQAVRENQTYVIYVVYDTDDKDDNRRRRLQEEDGEGGEGQEGEDNHEGEEGGEQEGGSQDQQQQEEGQGEEQANNKQYGYGYGYGYYNAYGEFVSQK